MKALSIIMTCCLLSFSLNASSVHGKFVPAEGKVLVFIGQDNASVGGSKRWPNGYVDTIGVPSGITHYIYFSEGKISNSGATFSEGSVDGLNSIADWNAGPMCMRCYLESDTLQNMLVHLSISMEHDDEPLVASGKLDHNIQELADFFKEFHDVPFYLRIGYEFDGPWNTYEPDAFKKAWRRIVDTLRSQGIDNFATVLGSFTVETPLSTWEAYWPGDNYVDWIGYSYWANGEYNASTLEFARKKGLPVMLAEVSPRGYVFDTPGSEKIWYDWFDLFFRHVENNLDVIKAISYINAHWNTQPMWHNEGWGNSQIQDNAELKQKWLNKMAEDTYIHTVEGTYEAIGFKK